MTKVRIRSARPEDVDGMTALDALCFAAPWSRKSFESEVCQNPLARYLVAETIGEDPPRLAGYAGLWAVGEEGHITNVAVHPDCRRQHLGRLLVASLISATFEEGLRDYTLEVRVGNLPAIRLYEHFGFREAGVRKGYYEDNNEDAMIMWLTVGEPPRPEEP
jgi:ribosomal-protein-alanine N-acetyltransferase